MKRFLALSLVLTILTAMVSCIADTEAAEDTPNDFFGSLWSSIGGIAEDVAGIAEDAGEWASGAVNDAGEWISNAAEDTGEWVTHAAEDTAEWVTNAAGDTVNWVSGTAADAWRWTTENAVTAWEFTTGVASDVWDWSTTAAGDAWNWSTDFIANTSDTFLDAFGEFKNSILSAAIDSVDTFRPLYENLCNMLDISAEDAGVLWNALLEYADEKGITPLSMAKLVLAGLICFISHGTVGQASEYVTDTLKEWFDPKDLYSILIDWLEYLQIDSEKAAEAQLLEMESALVE